MTPVPDHFRALVKELMLIPGLSGFEGRVRRAIREKLDALGIAHRTDLLGNLVATLKGDPDFPSVAVIAHMDQLGFMVRKVESDGMLRLERVGGVPERALAGQAVLVQSLGQGPDVPGVIGNKSHHATAPEEKYRVLPYGELRVDCGFRSPKDAAAAGVGIGSPVVYHPRALDLANGRIAGTAIDDRAGCAVLLDMARRSPGGSVSGTMHLVWSVQEEFNLRGVLPLIADLKPDSVIQIDLALACDTPDMADRGEVRLGGGPVFSHYSFHGRGTLNGLIPDTELLRFVREVAQIGQIPVQHSVHTGALTETAYLQHIGTGLRCLDLGFPMRFSHSAMEVADLEDLWQLANLLEFLGNSLTPQQFRTQRVRFQ
jgi:putative aminopeptidase FrvX